MHAQQLQLQTHDEAMAAIRRELIDKGLLVLGDDGYRCTAEGREIVRKEMRRYITRQDVLELIQIEAITNNGCSVW